MGINGYGYKGLIGQDKAKNLLSRSFESERIPHALLLKGPDGVGKQLFARGVAAVVNCREKLALSDACGKCVSCKKYQSGNHPDFDVIQPEKGAIKIAQVRDMCKSLSYPPYESETRVVLMEDVHTMRQEAANSLLKTLEEPPENNLLILTADTSQEILPTILSRCQVIPFFSLSAEKTAQIIRDNSDVDESEANLLARLSEGSPGRGLLFQKAELVPLLKIVIELLVSKSAKSNNKVGDALKIAEEMAGLKENLPSFLGLLRLWYRDLLVSDFHADGLIEKNEIFALDDGEGRKLWNSEEIFAKLGAIEKAEDELRRNCNRPLVCEVLLFSLQ